MWRAVNPDGTLTYSFVESVAAMHPFYIVRFLGACFSLSGMLLMAYNLWKTIAGATPVVHAIPARPEKKRETSWLELLTTK